MNGEGGGRTKWDEGTSWIGKMYGHGSDILHFGRDLKRWSQYPEILAKGTREAESQGSLSMVPSVEPYELMVIFFVLVFMKQDYTMSLLSPGWPWTGDPPVSASQGLGLCHHKQSGYCLLKDIMSSSP